MYVLATTPGDADVVNTKKTPPEPSTQWKSSPRINSNAPLKVVVSLELIVILCKIILIFKAESILRLLT